MYNKMEVSQEEQSTQETEENTVPVVAPVKEKVPHVIEDHYIMHYVFSDGI